MRASESGSGSQARVFPRISPAATGVNGTVCCSVPVRVIRLGPRSWAAAVFNGGRLMVQVQVTGLVYDGPEFEGRVRNGKLG